MLRALNFQTQWNFNDLMQFVGSLQKIFTSKKLNEKVMLYKNPAVIDLSAFLCLEV